VTFLLRVDRQRWQANVDRVLAQYDAAGGQLVPVAKSNGYGLGQALLAHQMRERRRPVLAVGTVYEALDPHLEWDADLLVLTPWNAGEAAAQTAWATARQRYGTMLITTVADSESLRALAAAAADHPARPVRVLLEGLTSVRRFGFTQPELLATLHDPTVRQALASGALRLAGLALHLPLVPPELAKTDPTLAPQLPGSGRAQQAGAWALWWLAQVANLPSGDDTDLSAAPGVWVSHLTPADLDALRAAVPNLPVYPRIGTALWLGDAASLRASGTVLAVHTGAQPGAGYFQRRVPNGASLVVVGGGTSHGVALSGPIGAATFRRRISTAGSGVLDAAGRVVSPFRWRGKRLWFHEAPHASVSLLVVPKGVPVPVVGDELPCQVRLTTSHFDQVVFE